MKYSAEQVAPTAVHAQLAASGQLRVYSPAATDVLVDVAGFIAGDAGGPGGPPTGGGEVEVASCDAGSELVVIRNPGAVTANLASRVRHDEGNLHSVDLGTLASSLGAGQQLGIKSGDGAIGAGQVRWKTRNVWNNDGDTAYLISPTGATTSKPCS